MVLLTKRILRPGWGGQGEKPRTKIINDILREEPRVKSINRKKRVKKTYTSPRKLCAFCKTELPLDTARMEADRKKKGYFLWLGDYRIKECPVCNSYEAACCPACRRKTWFNPSTKIYKHQVYGCGFEGLSLEGR